MKHTYHLLFSFNCFFSILCSPESPSQSQILFSPEFWSFCFEIVLFGTLSVGTFWCLIGSCALSERIFNLLLTGTLGYHQPVRASCCPQNREAEKHQDPLFALRLKANFSPQRPLWIILFNSTFGLLGFSLFYCQLNDTCDIF